MKQTNPDGTVTPGITFTRSADYIAQSHGNFRWTQIVTNLVSWTDVQGVKHYKYEHGLDNFVQLTTNEFRVNDSPQTKFNTDYREISRCFTGKMYLMYKSSVEGSIWVAINVVRWDYEWQMKKNTNNNWDWIKNEPPVVDIKYEYGFPLWDNIVVNDPI